MDIFEEYRKSVLSSGKRVEQHHVIPVSLFWPDIAENLEWLIQTDHQKLHSMMDMPMNLFSKLTRAQRKRENGHIVLTESDIEWRADIQRVYLENVDKLPWFMQDLHDIKLGELATSESMKFERLTQETYPLELWDALGNHQLYIDIQKEISKWIYQKLKM